MMFVYERMAELREQAGRSSEEFRSMVDIAPKKYARIESGETSPSCHELARIARVLNISVDYLLGMDIPVPPEIPEADSLDDTFRIRFIRLLNETGGTLETISKVTGKGMGTVKNWRTGQNKPAVSALMTLARHFGCSTDYLLGISMQRNPSEPQNSRLLCG